MASAILILSCGQNDTKQKELELKEKELALKEKDSTSSKITATDTVKKNNVQETKKSSPNSTMAFKEYSEGDLMHLHSRTQKLEKSMISAVK